MSDNGDILRPDGQVPVTTSEIGMPLPPELVHHPIPPEYELAAKLQIWLPKIQQSVRSATDMLHLVTSLKKELRNIGIDTEEALLVFERGSAFSVSLEKFALQEEFDFVEYILRVSPNVLGVFRYNPENDAYGGRSDYYPGRRIGSEYRTHIELYWGAISLCATALGLSIEGLTAKVLAHEFGHAYSYLGYDRNGTRWRGMDFANSDINLKEGLAQYYAYRIGRSLERKIPELLVAYKDLLPRQREEYRSHLPWLENDSPEALGAVLAKIRRRGAVSVKEFGDELIIEKQK